MERKLLKEISLEGITIHSDLFSVIPSAISIKRADKVGKEPQKPMEDKEGGSEECILCNPLLKSKGNPIEATIENRVCDFINDAPFLSEDHRVIFLCAIENVVMRKTKKIASEDKKLNDSEAKVYSIIDETSKDTSTVGKISEISEIPLNTVIKILRDLCEKGFVESDNTSNIQKNPLHRFRLSDFREVELYWLLKGCIKRGNECLNSHNEMRKQTTDPMRMVVGFNLGKLAGQSIPHFHAQYGWEAVLNPPNIKKDDLEQYFKELDDKRLIIHQTDRIKIVAPWTPKGQYALELYFNNKFDICEMDDEDIKTFAVVGCNIIKKYLELGIQNLNIVFTNSPGGYKTEPLVAHFVPRVNIPAFYEIKGVNVVDTPPEKIVDVFSGCNWEQIVGEIKSFNPNLW